MNIRGALLNFVACSIIAACSKKAAPAGGDDARQVLRDASLEREAQSAEREQVPDEEKVADDCLALVRATKFVVPPRSAIGDCPTCPAGGTEVLTFRSVQAEGFSCSAGTCTVVVTIRAVFNSGTGEAIGGGLTAWIPVEQRSAILRGNAPAGEQAYRIQITYKRTGESWRAIEFDRAPTG